MKVNVGDIECVVGTVVRIGVSPRLHIEGRGSLRFAYRLVKKRPVEEKPLLAVGDVLECKVTAGPHPKVLSLRVLDGGKSGPASLAKQYPLASPPSPLESCTSTVDITDSTSSVSSIESNAISPRAALGRVGYTHNPYSFTSTMCIVPFPSKAHVF